MSAIELEVLRQQFEQHKLRAHEYLAPATVYLTREGTLLPRPTLGYLDDDARATAIRYIRADLYERLGLALGECKVLLGLSWYARGDDVVEAVKALVERVKEGKTDD